LPRGDRLPRSRSGCWTAKFAKLYGFTYQLYWAVIDKDGALLTRGFGPPNEEALAATVKKLAGR
jgi:hypothetical protein